MRFNSLIGRATGGSGLLSLLLSAGCSSPADWQVASVTAWLQDKYVLMVPHPAQAQVAVAAGSFFTKDADTRALFIEVAFQAVTAQRDSLSVWRSALSAAGIPDAKIPKDIPGEYRYFDSKPVSLVIGAARHEAKVIATLAETNILKIKDLAIVGEGVSPKGWTGSFSINGLQRFIGLVKLGEEARLTFVYQVPASFDRKSAKLDFQGEMRELPEYSKASEQPENVIWHPEMWGDK